MHVFTNQGLNKTEFRIVGGTHYLMDIQARTDL